MSSIYPITDLTAFIELFIFILIIASLYIIDKVETFRYDVSVLVVFSFNLVFCLYSIADNVIPFTPMFQLFMLFIVSIYTYYAMKNREDK